VYDNHPPKFRGGGISESESNVATNVYIFEIPRQKYVINGHFVRPNQLFFWPESRPLLLYLVAQKRVATAVQS